MTHALVISLFGLFTTGGTAVGLAIFVRRDRQETTSAVTDPTGAETHSTDRR